ncbi:MAG: crotonase/enoyl-CoA hydratase family protein [Pseudomonadota bacterium]
MSDDGSITVEVDGGVLCMGLNRAEKLNGLTPHMFEELEAAYRQLEEDDNLRCGLLFAHGKHFTAGLDLPKFVGKFSGSGDFARYGELDIYNRYGHGRTKPLITAVNGITYTAGLELMLASDIAIAADDCRFAQMEPKRGLMAVGGATYRFIERGGWGNGMKWLLTGDEFNAEEAYRIGLVQEVVPAGEEYDHALGLAKTIASRAPLAVQATLENARVFALHGEDAAAQQFAGVQQKLANTKDFQEGVQSFIEKRQAQFTGK